MIFLTCLISAAWSQAQPRTSSGNEESLAQIEQAIYAAKKNLDILDKEVDAEKTAHAKT